jgi:hypothetical protein
VDVSRGKHALNIRADSMPHLDRHTPFITWPDANPRIVSDVCDMSSTVGNESQLSIQKTLPVSKTGRKQSSCRRKTCCNREDRPHVQGHDFVLFMTCLFLY